MPPAKKSHESTPAPSDVARAKVQPRHEILAVAAGMTGYRRGCKCMLCSTANRDRMRKWRRAKEAKADPDKFVEVKALGNGETQILRVDDMPAGPVSLALEAELPKTDGASPFQETIRAMMRKSARLIDNADALDRFDLINSMQLRLMHGISALAGTGAAGAPDAGQRLIDALADE